MTTKKELEENVTEELSEEIKKELEDIVGEVKKDDTTEEKGTDSKTFTQADVDKILAKRLAVEKAKTKKLEDKLTTDENVEKDAIKEVTKLRDELKVKEDLLKVKNFENKLTASGVKTEIVAQLINSVDIEKMDEFDYSLFVTENETGTKGNPLPTQKKKDNTAKITTDDIYGEFGKFM